MVHNVMIWNGFF